MPQGRRNVDHDNAIILEALRQGALFDKKHQCESAEYHIQRLSIEQRALRAKVETERDHILYGVSDTEAKEYQARL